MPKYILNTKCVFESKTELDTTSFQKILGEKVLEALTRIHCPEVSVSESKTFAVPVADINSSSVVIKAKYSTGIKAGALSSITKVGIGKRKLYAFKLKQVTFADIVAQFGCGDLEIVKRASLYLSEKKKLFTSKLFCMRLPDHFKKRCGVIPIKKSELKRQTVNVILRRRSKCSNPYRHMFMDGLPLEVYRQRLIRKFPEKFATKFANKSRCVSKKKQCDPYSDWLRQLCEEDKQQNVL